MYKVILVDDEAVVRHGLKHTIDWARHGFELIGDYPNGREAWEAVEEHKPDLIISDICMPFMDGLELAGAVASTYPYIKMIILTGFDEFQYAQQAIRLKVSDFVLKPITAQEIRDLLDKARNEMDDERKRLEDLGRLQAQLTQSLPLLKERFLERLVISGLEETEIAERFAYFGLPPMPPLYLVMVVDIDDFGSGQSTESHNYDEEILRLAAFDMVNETISDGFGLLLRTREERMVVIAFGRQDESALYEQTFRLAEEARHRIEKFLKFTVTVGIGRVCSSASGLPGSYSGALSALEYRFLLGKNRIHSILDMEGKPSFPLQPALDWDRKLVAAVRMNSCQEAQQLVTCRVNDLRASHAPMEACVLEIHKVVLSLLNTVQELGSPPQTTALYNQINELYRYKTLDDIEAWFKQLVQSIMTAITENRAQFTNMQIMRAVEYIDTNYANEKISLQELCRHVLMSTSYFSLVFKQHTGETFVEYLTRVRMEKARELLQFTSLKFYEIADRIGYGDPNYFSILFKKHAGVSPREYRDRLAKERAG